MFTGKYLLADDQLPPAKRIDRMLPSDHVSVVTYVHKFGSIYWGEPHINVKVMQLCVCLSFCPFVHDTKI